MSAKVLVGYATRYGSTKEVAEDIAEEFGKQGLATECLPVKNVRVLAGYQAVVLGAPLYMFRWHADARKFLSRNRKALAGLPVAVFALGPFHNKEEEIKSAQDQLEKELARFPWLHPIAKEAFVGKFDPARLDFPFNLIPALKQMPAVDERNWERTRGWAGSVAQLLL